MFNQKWKESKNELDISNFDAVEAIIKNFIPDIIINAAAYTNVEKAENDEVNLHNANVLGPYNLAYLSKKYKKKLIHISTDYIFDGQKKFPYVEEDDAKPLSKYGKSKLEGEKKIILLFDEYLIFRVSWLFGLSEKNFISKLLKLADNNDQIKVTEEEIGVPTYVDDFAKFLWFATKKFNKGECRNGIYHYSQNGRTVSRFDFAKIIFQLIKQQGMSIPELFPVKSSDLNFKAKRPKYSVLDSSLAENYLNDPIISWDKALYRDLNEFLAFLGAQGGGKVGKFFSFTKKINIFIFFC